MRHIPTALTIAGSDSGGGAGIQADLKTFSAFGVYGTSAITAVTAQNTLGVDDVRVLDPDIVLAQVRAVLSDIGAGAVKVGMLGEADVVAAVGTVLEDVDAPVVVDPVMVAKSGHDLLTEEAVRAVRRHVLPQADLLTPNLPEAARLLDEAAATSLVELERQGHRLLVLGARAVLMKGGHAPGEEVVDLLVTPDGTITLRAPRIMTANTHGTGCSLSSAIAAGLALGEGLESAVRSAHGWLHRAIRAADGLHVGAGHGPVHHFHEVWA